MMECETKLDCQEPMMSMLFSVENHHPASFGPPPAWVNLPRQPGVRRYYFENAQGEQWVAAASKDSFRVTGGDISWKEILIERPDYRALLVELQVEHPFQGWIIAPEERFWLLGVCSAQL
jgi:hypothetical protein